MTHRTLAVLAVAVALPAHALEIEVGPGDDLRTLTRELGPGDEVIFSDGEYVLPGEWTVTASGTEDEPVLLRPAPGAAPVLRLTTEGSRVLRVVDSTHLRVQGLTFEMDDDRYENTRGNGVRVENSQAVRIESCVVRHVGGTGVVFAGDNVDVALVDTEIADTRDGNGVYAGCGDASCWMQDSLIANNLIVDIKSPEEFRADGIFLAPGAQGNTLRDNVVVDINRIGIIAHSTEFGARNTIEGNAVWNTGNDGLWISGAALVRNNLVFQAGDHAFYSENNEDKLENLVVTFNTFATSENAAVRLNDWAGKPGMVFANNAVINPVGEAFEADEEDLDEGILISANVMTGQVELLDTESGAFYFGGGYTDVVDWSALDYYPTRNAVLRDGADASGEAFVPDVDFNGLERNGETPTIGAYEFVGEGNPGWAVDATFKTFEDDRADPNDEGGGCCRGDADGAEAALVVPLLGLGLLGARRRRRR